ncbi:hypothetical protein SEPCBS57363_006012 [Sporothrix epigloea]|uniref:DUF7357 domain-containing protein n=1 Tax=Sporothrix epigloea TaxID=1892477 RepID=A0ABP0E4S0_9PEZI
MSVNLLRLRLHIQRNGVPDTRIVFLAATTENTTVAQLLEQVNDTIPLESPDWGLDDYAVEVSLSPASPSTRFECLHYQIANKLFDNDAEVFIRPLSSEDLKKLRIGGRHQISLDGKHLVDGLPFGRPLLKRLRGRPPVALAPRKPPRPFGNESLEFQVEGEVQDDEGDDYSMKLVPYGTRRPGDEEDGGGEDGEEESFNDSEEEEEGIDAAEIRLLLEDVQNPPDVITPRYPARVRFAVVGESASKDSNQLGNEDDSNFHSFNTKLCTSSISTEADQRDSKGGSESSDGNETQEIPSERQSLTPVPASQSTVAPNQGKTRTKKRNARRRAKQAMEKSREEDTRAISSASPSTQTPAEPDVPDAANVHVNSQASLGQRLRLDMGASRRFIASALGLRSFKKVSNVEDANKHPADQLDDQPDALPLGVEIEPENNTRPPPGHPENWASRIDYTAVECCDKNFVLDKPSFPFVQQWHAIKGQNGWRQKKSDHALTGTKRKQDTAFSMKAPEPKKRAAPSTSSESSLESSSDSDCIADDDGDYEHRPTRAVRSSAGNVDSLCSNDSDSDSDSDSFHAEEDDSDSSSDESSIATDAEDSTKIAEGTRKEDLPPLPVDITALPALEPGQAAKGMLLTWKDWVLSERTNWQPQVIDITARVVDVSDNGESLGVVIAHRDRELNRKPAKQYDEVTGERLYGRFDGPDVEDDDTDDADSSGYRTVLLTELMEPRVLLGVFKT